MNYQEKNHLSVQNGRIRIKSFKGFDLLESFLYTGFFLFVVNLFIMIAMFNVIGISSVYNNISTADILKYMYVLAVNLILIGTVLMTMFLDDILSTLSLTVSLIIFTWCFAFLLFSLTVVFKWSY